MTFSLLVDDEADDFDDRIDDATEDETGGGDNPKAEWNVSCERAGRLSARAALCRRGDTVEEKL